MTLAGGDMYRVLWTHSYGPGPIEAMKMLTMCIYRKSTMPRPLARCNIQAHWPSAPR